MTRDEIIRMAREAGVGTGFSVHIPKWDEPTWLFVKRFAALVAAAEREACARLVEEEYVRQFEEHRHQNLVAAIRARGEKK